MEVKYGLSKDFIFKEAVAFLKRKAVLPDEVYERLSSDSRAKAFTVSGYTSLEVLQEFLDCLTKAAEEGTTKEQFREEMNHFLQDHGYEEIDPWHSDNIFRTNMQTAFNAGHYESMTDETAMKMRPYWRYRTAGDGHVRESHAVMGGRVYRADDPIWDIWYPPNGFRCRCIRAELSGDTDALLKELGRLEKLELKGALNAIGEGLRTSTVERFEAEESPEGKKWKPSIRASMESGGKTLTQSGKLKTHIGIRVSGSGLAVGTNDIRAATHQFGDTRTIRAKNQKYLRFMVGGQWRRAASVRITIPPRPFLGISEADEQEIKETLEEILEGK